MADEGISQHVNFHEWERNYETAVARYRATNKRDDYTEAEDQRVRLGVRLLTHRDEIAASLQDDKHLTESDRAKLRAISDRLTKRVCELEPPITP